MTVVRLDVNVQMYRISGFNPGSIILLLSSIDKLFNLFDSRVLSKK